MHTKTNHKTTNPTPVTKNTQKYTITRLPFKQRQTTHEYDTMNNVKSANRASRQAADQQSYVWFIVCLTLSFLWCSSPQYCQWYYITGHRLYVLYAADTMLLHWGTYGSKLRSHVIIRQLENVALPNALELEAARRRISLCPLWWRRPCQVWSPQPIDCRFIALLLLTPYPTQWTWPLTFDLWPLTFDLEHL